MATAYATPYDHVALGAAAPAVAPDVEVDGPLAPVLPLRRPAPAVDAATYLRRRIVVGAGLLVLVLALVAGVRAVAGAVEGPAAPAAVVPAVVPIVDTVQLQPGDTLWDLAVAHTAAGEDPRVTLASIRDLNGFGTDVVPAWTTVAIPGS